MNRLPLGITLVVLFTAASPVLAGTTTTLVRADTLTARDAHLLAATANQNYGSLPELIIRDTKGSNRGNAVLDFALPDLTGRTVLEAWLRLRQHRATKSKPSSIRVYPVSQSWVESQVTWNNRSSGSPWTTPGGTYPPNWSDQVTASTATVGSTLSWQVGPILSAYATGAYGITGAGFLLRAEPSSPDRELRFRSSEHADTTVTPLLEIVSTDLAPAVTSARAEVQPRRVAEFQTALFTLYIEADLAGLTPSGAPTGFDVIRVAHGGAIGVTTLDQIKVAGVPLPPGSASFSDDGAGCTIQLAQAVTQSGRVEIRFRATVLVGAASRQFALPVYLRNSGTGAGNQAAWPMNADGIAGNGDDWFVSVFSTNTSVHILSVSGPATALPGETGLPFAMRVRNTGLQAVSIDFAGLQFSRSVPGDADADFTVLANPANPDSLNPGDEKVLDLSVDVATGAGPGPVVVDGNLVVMDLSSGGFFADLGADTTHTMTLDASPTTVSAQQSSRSVLPGARDVEILSFSIRNEALSPLNLTQVTVANTGTGPGTPAQLDAELDSLALRIDDGDGIFEPGIDAQAGTAVMTGGAASFSGLSVAVPAQDSLRLFVAAGISVLARDGDVLDFALPVGALVFSPGVPVETVFPLAPAGEFRVDGMAAAQVVLHPVPPRTLIPGALREPVFDATLPANGYEADVLQRLNVENLGTAEPGLDLDRLEVWKDQGNPGFNASEDRLLGSMSFTGARWEITGLWEAVPVSGLRVIVTADVNPLVALARTIRMGIPSGEDRAVGMASGNSGPLDEGVANPEAVLITVPDRVTLSAKPIASAAAYPGQAGVVLLDLDFFNTYAEAHTLTRLAVTNRGSGAGSQAEQDANLRVLSLYRDANRNGVLDDPDVDPLLGTGSFIAGYLRFDGFEVPLPAGGRERLFLAAQVSLGAADGDLLSAALEDASDVDFLEPTATAAAWPVTSAAAWSVDGLVSDQVTVLGSGPVTLGPADGPVLAFDFRLPGNGYRSDILNGLRVENPGSAVAADLAELRLWADGGDGSFDAGAGDDSNLGLLIPSGSGWQSLSMSKPLPPSGSRFFISLTVAPGFTDSADVELELPLGGVLVSSANDGPLDRPVSSARRLELSDAPLLAQLDLSPSPSTTSQSVQVTMTVQNRGSEACDGIHPGALSQSGTGALGTGTGPLPASVNLAPGSSGTFTWTLPAAAAGDVVLSASVQGIGAVSGLVRSSRQASSGVHHIYAQATQLNLSALEFMPSSVTIGQAGVVPLNLTFTNPGVLKNSDIVLENLRIRVEDEDGTGIVPSTLLSRVVVSEGQSIFADKSAIESAGAEVNLALGPPFATPRIAPGSPVTLSLRLHIAGVTSVSKFRVVIEDATWFVAEDAVSADPVVTVLETGSFPIRTGLVNIVSEANLVEARGASPGSLRAGPGQSGVRLLSFTLENMPGSGAASTVRISSLALVFADETGTPMANPGSLFPSLDLAAGGQSTAFVDLSGGTGDSVTVVLSPPLTLLQGTPVSMLLSGQLAASALPSSLRVHLGAGSSMVARDGITGRLIPVSLVPEPLGGDTIRVESRAEALRLGGTAGLPSTVTVGDKNLTAIQAVFEHPGLPGTARIRVDSLAVAVRDDRENLLAPGSILDRVGVVWNGREIAAAGVLSSTPGLVRLALPSALLQAGESASVSFVVDIDAGAPAARFQITVHEVDVHATDANLGTAVDVSARAGSILPLVSGIAEIRSPSRELLVDLTSSMPAALAADGTEVLAGQVSLRNPSPDGSSALRIGHFRVIAADADRGALPVGSAALRVRLHRNGVLWAESAVLSPDSTGAWIAFPQELSIPPGKSESLELRMVTSPSAPGTGLRLGFDRLDVGVIQPEGALLTVTVRPEGGQGFPLWTEAGHFGATTLKDSYSNFPNPFAAGREATSFVYYLPSDGRVTLRVWTLRGEEVLTIEDAAPRSAGLHQDDGWDGRNTSGGAVLSGVYIAELIVDFDNGTRERLLRKVAVVR